MKILKVKSRTYKGKHYYKYSYKYRVNLPEKTIIKACFRAGDELEVKVKKGEIRLRGGNNHLGFLFRRRGIKKLDRRRRMLNC